MRLTCVLFVILVGVVEMATKFSQELYAKMKAKKKEPLSSIGEKGQEQLGRSLSRKHRLLSSFKSPGLCLLQSLLRAYSSSKEGLEW